jgi:hypothetical protein
MKSIRLGLATLLTVALASIASAQNVLDPAFRVVGVKGECQISIPGEGGFKPAEESKAYPYGSTIRTGARSSLMIIISEGNRVRVLANANLVMDENASDTKIKNVRLNDGEVHVELNSTFHQGGNKLNVETATAICGAVGTEFLVKSGSEENMRIVLFRVIKGVIAVYGENFDIATLDANDWLSVVSPEDRSFLRLQNMKGAFDIRIKDQEMNDKELPTQPGNVLKIFQRRVDGTNERVITAQLIAPDGSLIEEFTVTIGADQPLPPGPGGEPTPWPIEEIPTGRTNPLPPEDFIRWLIDRTASEENVELNTQRTAPRPPAPLSPTPVGRR